MSAELGIGKRVWVGFTDKAEQGAKPYMCQTGVIDRGPEWIEAGLYRLPGGRLWGVNRDASYWRIQFDDGVRLWAEEPIIFPLDGGEPEAKPEPRDIKQPAEA